MADVDSMQKNPVAVAAGESNFTFFYQLGALLYKNFILGKRLWRSTLCHLLIPCLMVIIFGIIASATASSGEVRVPSAFAEFSSTGVGSNLVRGLPACRVFDDVGGRYGLGVPIPKAPCITLAYAPSTNADVNAVMSRVAQLNRVSFSSTNVPNVDIVGFASSAELIAFALANPARVGHGVVFPSTFIVQVNETLVLDPAGVPTIPIEVLYNKSASGEFYGATGDDLMVSVGIISTPLQIHRAVVEAVLSVHTDSAEADVSFDIRRFPMSSSRDATSSLDNLVGIFVYLGIMIPFVLTIRHVVAEKENNILDAMRMTGLRESAYWLSWFLYFALTSLVSTVLMYIVGVAMNTPIFVFVDGNVLFPTLYFYFLSTLCLALFLSAIIPTTKVAIMVGFVFLAVGVVAQAIFSLAGVIITIIYNPFILPTAGLRALNLYPPIIFSRLTTDFSFVIRPYVLEGTQDTLRDRYTMREFVDGVYRYGSPDNAAEHALVNSTSCITDADRNKYPLASSCFSFQAQCPVDRTNFLSSLIPCPTLACSADWGEANNNLASCTSAGGVLVGGDTCECRYVTASDQQTLNDLIALIPLYLVLAWYFGQVFTHGHGRAEPFYFPFLPWYWFPSLKKKTQWAGVFGQSTDPDVLAEENKVNAGEYDGSRPVIVRGLKKVYAAKRFTAVNGLSFAMEKGKCFALLGHNGAGKTTAIKMLGGLISITEGDVLVDGMSVRDSLSNVRQYIGACPQHDILWPELSAYQHLKFFGLFQGMSNLEPAIATMLAAVRLNREGPNPSSSYSGGMKRRLSVAIASLGDKRVVILDEPTTGMDPQNRSHVWKMISELKKDRVVLLTTHSMEEAEFLGDDIGIMSSGHLIALGNTLKLKSKFGGGYRLKLVVSNNAGAQVREAVTRFVPGAVLIDQSAGDMSYELPGSSDRQLPELFRWIEAQQGVLNDWAVSQVSLEDIFIRLTKESMPAGTVTSASSTVAVPLAALAVPAVAAGEGEFDPIEQAKMDHEALVADQADEELIPELGDQTHTWFSSFFSQFRGLFLKTFALFKRNKWTLCCQCLLPLILIAIIFAIKFTIESQLNRLGAASFSDISNCEQCIHQASQGFTNQLSQFQSCAVTNAGNEEQFCQQGSGVFLFKNNTLPAFGEQAWTNWFNRYTDFTYSFVAEQDLVLSNPIYAFCVLDPFPQSSFPLQNTCRAYQNAVNGSTVQEPATFFGSNPVGPSSNTPLRYMVVSDPSLDVGSKCFNNGSTPLVVPGFDNNNKSTFVAPFSFNSGSGPLAFSQQCTRDSGGSQSDAGDQFPTLTPDQSAALGAGSSSAGCVISVTDPDALGLAQTRTQASAQGLLGFFPSEIIEGVASTRVRTLFANPTSTGLPSEKIFGLFNYTAACSSFPFNAINFNTPLTNDSFVSFVMQIRNSPSGNRFESGVPKTSSDIPASRVRLDQCIELRPNLFQSPALCPLETFGSVAPKHTSQTDLQARVDTYVFDMQELAKNELGFAAERKPQGAQGFFDARMDVLNHFPDASLVIKAFNPANSILKFSMQSYYRTGSEADYANAQVRHRKCEDSYTASNVNVPPSSPNNQVDLEVQECQQNPDLVFSVTPGFLVVLFHRFWGRAVDDSLSPKVCGEETFIFSGLATAALRYASANGHNVPASPVTDPNTRFLLGVRPFPFKDDARADSLAVVELVISLMVDLLVPFAITLLWPMFSFHFVHEKELKLRAMQSMMGMRTDCYFLVSYVFDFVVAFTMLILIYLCGFFMSIAFFARNQGALIILLFFIWANTLVALTFFFQTFFSRTRTSNVILYILLLGGVIGAFILNFSVFTSTFLPAPDWYLIWPPFVMYRAIHLLTKRSFFLADLSLEEELARLFGILFLETMILFLTAFYFDMVVPREYGRPRHPLFFLITPYKECRRRFKGLPALVEDEGEAYAHDKVLLAQSPMDDEDPDVAAERIMVENKQYARPPAVEIVHLKKIYGSGKVAVEDVTLHMETGEVFCLLGPNGAGKSTVIGVLTGLFSGSKGKASVNGFDVSTEMHRIYERLGVTPQFDTLWPSLTVMEHLLYYSRIKCVPKDKERALALKAAQAVRLSNALNKKSRELSGGMRRRLSLAISLVGNPLTIFLDEPSTGLDPETRRQIWQLIEREKKQRCIVLTTHSMEEAEALASRVAIMAHGMVKTVGTTMQLKSKYGDGYRIQVGFTAGNDTKAEAFVKRTIPGAVLAESRLGLKVYKVAREDGKVSAIFEAFLNRDVEASGVEDWGIEQSTLEQVFLKIAAESERVFGTA